MPPFSLIEQQLNVTARQHPDFACQEAGLGRLIRAVDRLLTDKANHLLRNYGLSLTEYNALIMLDASSGGLTVSELTASTGEKPSNITRLTDQLVRKGLVNREVSPLDRRVWVLRFTSEGEALMERVLPSVSGLLEEFFAPIDGEQRRELKALLKSLLVNAFSEQG